MAKNLRQYTREFVRDSDDTNLIIIDNLVYDLTYFFDEHPGGCEVLYEHIGLDATEAFESVGHSADARNLMFKYLVGEIVVNQRIDRNGSKYITPSVRIRLIFFKKN